MQYNRRVDISDFHANFINANSKKGSRKTGESLIGKPPILSDEIPGEKEAKDTYRKVRMLFPQERGPVKFQREIRKEELKAKRGG